MTETKPTGMTTGGAAPHGNGQQSQQRLSSEDRKIVYRLQDHIDENGKYADALKPIALGYAAGKGVGEYEAKQAIDARFEQEIGMSMKAYLEDHRQKRGLSVGNER